jgi:hypothetical protein
MIILDLLPSNSVDIRRASALRDAAFMLKGLCSLYEEMSKLSTKDLLALASMKNVAKREM